MTLRLRLLLGYGYLFLLTFVATGTSVLGFLHLSEGIDRVLEENYASIRASMLMLDALERQDSEILTALLEGKSRNAAMEALEEEFTSALETARGNVTEEREGTLIEEIAQGFAELQRTRDELLRDQPAERRLAAYDATVSPAFVVVKRRVRALLDINQAAMVEADREAKAAALRNGAWLGFLVAVALLSLIHLSRGMRRHVLARLSRLRDDVDRMAAGDEDRRLREDGDDELTAVARGVNVLVDRQQSRIGEVQARLSLERRLLLGLLDAASDQGSLYDLGGRLRGSVGRASQAVGDWIRSEGKARVEAGERECSARVDGYEVQLLGVGSGRRPAGWLAVPARGAAGEEPPKGSV